jgi:hypothetical protein
MTVTDFFIGHPGLPFANAETDISPEDDPQVVIISAVY